MRDTNGGTMVSAPPPLVGWCKAGWECPLMVVPPLRWLVCGLESQIAPPLGCLANVTQLAPSGSVALYVRWGRIINLPPLN